MADVSISAEARAVIGTQAAPQTCEVTKTAIRRFARAIGDANPVYVDAEHAAGTQYGGIVAPPTFFFTLGYYDEAPATRLREDGRPIGAELDVPLPVTQTVGGASAVEFGEPIRPGDVITASKRVADVYCKEGKSGTLYFTVVDATYMNQKNEFVARERATFIER